MTELYQPFGLRDGQPIITGTICGNCQHSWFPAVEYGCERCGSYGKDLSAKIFSMKGKIISSAEIWPGTEKAFTLCTIELEGGPAIRAVLGSSQALNVDDPVQGRIETIADKSFVRFYAVGEN